ncbi:MAG: P1 family peptidase [Candidatus Aminicenantes bacterium]|nr:P1 family peptidase [Candidatus Aminicenantes bacterium]
MIILGYPVSSINQSSDRVRARDIGIEVGIMVTGPLNAITDVAGVSVGHQTLRTGKDIRTGVTVILPHSGNIYQEKVPAAIYFFNAYGKLAGYTQVEELGNIETPIALTNTLSVGTCMTALVRYTLRQNGNESVRSVNAVVGETNDGFLNNIRAMRVSEADVWAALRAAATGPVDEGSVGAGTGTSAFGFKGGIGTSSRITPEINGKQYTIGVLVQSNFGWSLRINGVPVGRELDQEKSKAGKKPDHDGSCMIVIATDAPLSSRNLKRLAKRAFIGMGRTRSVMSNGSGDYAIVFSTAYRIPHQTETRTVEVPDLIDNDTMTTFFRAVEEATEEAIYNSLFRATTTRGYGGHICKAVPIDKVLAIMKKYNSIKTDQE